MSAEIKLIGLVFSVVALALINKALGFSFESSVIGIIVGACSYVIIVS